MKKAKGGVRYDVSSIRMVVVVVGGGVVRHLSLFTGIGGFELAAQRVWGEEWEPYCFCEMDEFCQAVLKKHWPDVPIFSDVRDVRLFKEDVEDEQEVMADAEKRESGEPEAWDRGESACRRSEAAGIDLLTGGFPCQPFSAAGKRDGRSDNRYLWPEMLRVIRDFKPTWVVAENVRGILSIEDGLVFEQVCTDLEDAGYEVQPFVIPAVAVDAHHRRDRVWFVAHSGHRGRWDKRVTQEGDNAQGERASCTGALGGSGSKPEDVADSQGKRLEGGKNTRGTGKSRKECNEQLGGCSQGNGRTGWLPEPHLGELVDGLSPELASFFRPGDGIGTLPIPRVARGIPNRVQKLKALGNAIVPAVAEQIFRAIKEAEHSPE